jgi:hypothetical protein
MTETHEIAALQLDDAEPLLRSTPEALRHLLAPLPDAWLDFQEAPEAWSPRTVVVHLIHNERTNWLPRATVILSQAADRKFPPFQQLPEPAETASGGMLRLLDEFASQRQASLEKMRAFRLAAEDYRRTGEHPVLGTVTLANLLATWVVHDLNHTHQILKSLAKLQGAAVGPWRKFLGILDLP